MTVLRRLLTRVRGRGRERQDDFDREIDSHLELHAADNVRAGMSAEEARRRALVALGGAQQTRERYRDALRVTGLESFLKDIQFGVRTMRRGAGFTLLAIVTVAVGIAATNTAFMIVNTVLLRPLPFERPDRIVGIGIREQGGEEPHMSFADFRDWERSARSFDALGAFDETNMNVSDEDRAPEQIEGAYVSAGTFRVLRVAPILGRYFTNDDERPGAAPVVILNHVAWQSRYGGAPDIIGRTIRVNAQPSTVIGIMPAWFEFPFNNKIWLPLSAIPGLSDEPRDSRSLRAIGRLADGTSAAEAAAELNAIHASLARDFSQANPRTRPEVVHFRPGIGTPWYVILGALMTAVGLLLVVSCANVANLLLARSLQRAREVSIRASLGATRWRVVRQLLVESVMLSVAAGLLALVLSWAGIQVLLGFVEQIGKPAWMDFSMNTTVFLFLATVCVGAGVLFGVVPALYISKHGGSGMLKQSARRTATAGVWARRATGALVVAEVILTVVLVAGAVSMMRHLREQSGVARVIDTAHLLTANLTLSAGKYPAADDRIAFFRRLEERLASAPGAASIAIANVRPFLGAGNGRVSSDGRSRVPGERLPSVQTVTVGSRYFEVLGLGLRKGRTLTMDDAAPGRAGVVVNERFVEEFLPGQEPLGRAVTLFVDDRPAQRVTIVGIAPTLRRDEMSRAVSTVYVPYLLNPTAGMILLARSGMDTPSTAAMLREEVRALDADLPLFQVRTLDDVLSELLWVNRVFGGMFVIFAALAVLVATVGVYGVVAFTMTQRTQEIGIRMALGAPRERLWWTMMRSKIGQIGLGLSVGVAAAFLLLRLMGGLLVGRFGQDPVTFVASAGFLMVVSASAMLWPVWRATAGSPVAALRYE